MRHVPHQPVEAIVVGRNPRGAAGKVSRFDFELVLLPLLLFPSLDRVREVCAGALQDDLFSHSGDGTEGAVRVDETPAR